MTQTQKLERLRNRRTLYEVAAIRGESRVLISYAGQHSRHGLMKAISIHGQQIVDVFQLPATARMTFGEKASDGVTLPGGIVIRFTGRTEREAILSGELSFIGELARVAKEVAA
jgi:hypothetical protein